MADRHRPESRSDSLASVKRLSGNGAGKKGGQMQNLLGEFKGLYEGKLKRLDEAERGGEDINRVSYMVCSDGRILSLIHI